MLSTIVDSTKNIENTGAKESLPGFLNQKVANKDNVKLKIITFKNLFLTIKEKYNLIQLLGLNKLTKRS